MARLRIGARLEVPADKSPEGAKVALIKLAEATIKEPECYQFDVLQDKENSRLFTLWECFEDEAALAHHFELPHTEQYVKEGWTEILYAERLTLLTEHLEVER